jgi:hypothetical protein
MNGGDAIQGRRRTHPKGSETESPKGNGKQAFVKRRASGFNFSTVEAGKPGGFIPSFRPRGSTNTKSRALSANASAKPERLAQRIRHLAPPFGSKRFQLSRCGRKLLGSPQGACHLARPRLDRRTPSLIHHRPLVQRCHHVQR